MGKTFVLAIAVAAAALGGCGGARSDGGGPRVERSYQVGQFDRIEVAGHYDVDVRTGAAPSVRASGAERDLQRLVVEVRSGKLSIHSRKHDGMSLGWSGHGPVRVAVTVPNLKAAQIAGSGELDIDRIAGESFEGVVAGSGSMRLGQLEVGRAKLAIAGAGEIRAQAGRAENAEYAIAGSGDLDVAGVVAQAAAMEVAGSGNIAANATRTASVEIAGSGDVTVKGGAKCSVSKAGSGNVHCS